MQLNIPQGEEIFLRLEENDVRKSQIQELLPPELLVIEQTRPPFNESNLNHIVLITYKAPGNKPSRLGFEARIQEITSDYRIILHKLNDPAPCDLRIWPRVRLDLLPNVRAFCHEKEIQVIDISGGGTHIVLRKDDCEIPSIGTTVNMKFIFEKTEIAVDGEVLRKWKDDHQRDHIAIMFTGNNNISHFIY
jgi:hypothetical protein